MDSSNWVDFKIVKQSVTMVMVLDHYQVNWLRKSGAELRGRCPIHKGEGSDAFHVSVSKQAFHCFSCKAKGNVLDFVAAMEQCTVRDAAVKLAQWFSVPSAEQQTENGTPKTPTSSVTPVESGGEGELVNQPLGFQLKGVDSTHAYLEQRGISRETAETFGVGFYSGKGSMSGRVVVPIHSRSGELLAYAGRSIDGSEPRYKLPTGFHKSAELYNLHRVVGKSAEVVIVEGFFDCIKVHQAGFACVALMGSSMSAKQEQLLVENFQVAALMFDGDAAGQAATDDCLLRLGRKLWVKAVNVPEGKQPDQLTADELQALLGN